MESPEDYLKPADTEYSEKNVPMFNILSLNQKTMDE